MVKCFQTKFLLKLKLQSTKRGRNCTQPSTGRFSGGVLAGRHCKRSCFCMVVLSEAVVSCNKKQQSKKLSQTQALRCVGCLQNVKKLFGKRVWCCEMLHRRTQDELEKPGEKSVYPITRLVTTADGVQYMNGLKKLTISYQDLRNPAKTN